VNEVEAELELLALARLGLSALLDGESVDADELPIDRLVKQGKLARHQALAARALLARQRIACPCGQVFLASEPSARASEARDRSVDEPLSTLCPGCGSSVARSSEGAKVLARAPVALAKGSRTGPFEVLERLGSGASGTVYKVRHVALGRASALKVVSAVDPEARRRFEREVEALARLDSPSIVKIHALHEVEGALAYEMELIEGETLAERIARGGSLGWREAALLVARLARAVDRVHALGILHRDLKPSNVLLGSGGRAAIADFGLARILDLSAITRSGTFLGTPLYMAPETLGGNAATPRSDIYGLGVILYEALTGRPPFREPTLAALFHKALRGKCEPARPPGAPAELDRIRARAMAPDPPARYATAGELAEALERVVAAGGGEPGEHPFALAGLALVACAATAVLGAAIALEARGRPTPPSTPREAAPLTVERALDALAGVAATESERSLALPVLLAAADADPGRTFEGRLAAAIERAPDRAELLAVRGRLACARGGPIRAEDLAAASSASLPLDALAAHALKRGLSGDAAPSVARALAEGHPDSRELAELEGILDAASGDERLRGEAERALERAHPGKGRAAALARALALADRVGAGLGRGEDVSGDCRPLQAELGRIAPSAEGERAVPFVLEPVANALDELWRGRRIDFALRRDELGAVLDLLGSVEACLSPRLVALRGALLGLQPDPGASAAPAISAGRLAGAAEALAAQEPLLAAATFDMAMHAEEEPVRTRLAWIDQADAALEAARARGFTIESEVSMAALVARRLHGDRGRLEEVLAVEDGPGAARGHLERALAARRRQLADAIGSPLLATQRDGDARAVLGDLFALGRTDEWEGPARELRDASVRDALGAEVLRRRGDVSGARALARRAVEEDTTGAPDPFAALALVLADDGDIQGARQQLERVSSIEPSTAPVIEAFRLLSIRARLDRAEPRSR
jgi:hypothetical protein